MSKEAKARIKINKLLAEAGWRLLDDKTDQLTLYWKTIQKLQQRI